MNKNLKKAFTLAEILIVLSIIGIIGAVCLTNLISKKPNKNLVMFKKSYNQASRVVSELINDEDLYPGSLDASGTTYREGFSDDSDVEYNGNSYGGINKFGLLFAEKMNKSSDICKEVGNPDNVCSATGNTIKFSTPDGIKWTIIDNNSCKKGQQIWVVIPKKRTTTPRNGCTCGELCADVNDCEIGNCINPNVFQIIVDSNGKITPGNQGEEKLLTETDITKPISEILK